MKAFSSAWIGGLGLLWSFLAATTPVADAQNIVEAAVAGGLDTLVAAVQAAGLVETLATGQDLTVFAPLNDAFDDLDDELLTYLLAPQGQLDLIQILRYHVVPRQVLAIEFIDNDEIVTLEGSTVEVSVNRRGDRIEINDSRIITRDILVDNGIIHTIDEVLIPPGFEEPATALDTADNAGLTTLLAALEEADLEDAIDDGTTLTIFAPTNGAFSALDPDLLAFLLRDDGIPILTQVLLLHVSNQAIATRSIASGTGIPTLLGPEVLVTANDSTVFFNGIPAIAVDIPTLNGFVNVIDGVLTDPSIQFPLFPSAESDVVGVALETGDFDTLIAAVEAAGLVETLRSPAAVYTVFAPTEDAFANLGEATLEFLLDADLGLADLTQILLYHVLPLPVLQAGLFDGAPLATLQGESVTITVGSGGTFVDESRIVAFDVLATNGVIHVIDAVLLPSAVSVPQTIPGTAIAAGIFNTLVAALQATDLVGPLQEDVFTVFAPIDDAFANLPFGVLNYLLTPDGNDLLTEILLYHVAEGALPASSLSNGDSIETLEGDDVLVTILGTGLRINNANVIQADVTALNGIIHVIDEVLINPNLEFPDFLQPTLDVVDTAVAGGFNTLVAAVQAAGLVDTLRSPAASYTVFAPTDDAFGLLTQAQLDFLLSSNGLPTLTSILLYHVLAVPVLSGELFDGLTANTVEGSAITISINGGDIRVNDSLIIATDILATNGVIHVIDQVLNPGFDIPTQDIVDTAIGAGIFNTLVSAVQIAGLEDTLRSPGPFTVFAPTDDAFTALFSSLPEEAQEFILGDAELLSGVLLYHVVSGAVFAADLVDGSTITTVSGFDVAVGVGAIITINQATVVLADVRTTNGVVHAIDAVLIPPGGLGLPAFIDIVDTAILDSRFSTLVSAVQIAGLVDTLRSPGPFTVFAPTNTAFSALFRSLEPEAESFILGDIPTLTGILTYHVVQGSFPSTDLVDGALVTTASGEDVEIQISGSTITLNPNRDPATVIMPDIEANNGFIHAIDSVLIPPGGIILPNFDDIVDTAIQGGFTTLVSAVQTAGLEDTLRSPGPFTVFAPTNDAFTAFFAGLSPEFLDFVLGDVETLSAILLYHVVSGTVLSTDLVNGATVATAAGPTISIGVFNEGGTITINQATVITPDILTINGVIHSINAVLNNPDIEIPNFNDIVDTAAGNPNFSTLVAAVQIAGLVDTLRQDGPFTVFAPTNDAFAALFLSLAPEAEAFILGNAGLLFNILLYHVVDTEIFSPQLVDGTTLTTVGGGDVSIGVSASAITVNQATVIIPDIETTNGVIHAIDAVLIPPGGLDLPTFDDIVDIAVATDDFSTLVAAVQAAGLVDTLRSPGPFTVFAPTDDAFTSLFTSLPDGAPAFILERPEILSSILLYHVLPRAVFGRDLEDGSTLRTVSGFDVEVGLGETVTINQATVIIVDVEASNGVIHVIDSVLIPPTFEVPRDIVGTAVNSDSFATLVTAVTTAGLVDALSFPEGPLTVFAPTENAFAKLPFGILDSLLLPQNRAVLTNVLLYHVVGESLPSNVLTNGQTVTTLFGETVSVSISGDAIFINDSQVVQADIVAINGVIHAIDAVLIPPSFPLPEPATCAIEDNVCGERDGVLSFSYCRRFNSQVSRTQCDSLANIATTPGVINCGCCADEEDPPLACLPTETTCQIDDNICAEIDGVPQYSYCLRTGPETQKTQCASALEIAQNPNVENCGCCDEEENPPFVCSETEENCAIPELVCGVADGVREYAYCEEVSPGVTKTQCASSGFIDRLDENFVNCGCCAEEERPPLVCLDPTETCENDFFICGEDNGVTQYAYCVDNGVPKTQCATPFEIASAENKLNCGCCEFEERPPDGCIPQREICDAEQLVCGEKNGQLEYTYCVNNGVPKTRCATLEFIASVENFEKCGCCGSEEVNPPPPCRRERELLFDY